MNQNKKAHNAIERITFIIGLVVLIAIIVYLTFSIIGNKSAPPHLVVTSTYLPAMPDYSFEVNIKNEGEETAENANIKLSLYQDGKPVESATILMAFVPVKSEETAWIVFHAKRKPSDSLVVSSLTYVKP